MNKKLMINAALLRKESEFRTKSCVAEKAIAVSHDEFDNLKRHCLKNVRELKSLGITILFEKEQIDTANMTDEMMITIMGSLAQEESTSISNNIKWSYQKRFEKGTVNVFSAPFGYKLSNGTLVIDEAQAEIVRTMKYCR